VVAERPGVTWISVTGYGRRGRAADWIAYGDDAAAAAGLASATGTLAGAAHPLFCGDAIADPLTGMHAAVAALAAYERGGGVLIALALRDVVAHVVGFGLPASPAHVRRRPGAADADAWEVLADGERQRVTVPRARPLRGVARSLGADTDAVLGGRDGRR
jgi:crotonobetainyl-CoA:carnitine CoA-transferase CaiB-like acyl-CoA transferase